MIHSMINQLVYISDTVTELFGHIDEELLSEYPIEDKMSVWEVCVHLTQIPQADLLICSGYSADQMKLYYEKNKPVNIQSAKKQFMEGIQELIKYIRQLSEDVLSKEFTTFWGSEYRIGEWILQIMNHLVHHRMQLYSYLLVLKQDVQLVLFR